MIIYKTINAYIGHTPRQAQMQLTQLKKTIEQTVPHAVAGISYGMPQYKLNGRLLTYFAAFRDHVSLFPGPVVIKQFARDLQSYKTSKGTIQFPLDKKLPLELIRKIIRHKAKTLAA